MISGKSSEKELFQRYKSEATKQLHQLSGMQRHMMESFLMPLFDEYERRYLGETISSADEERQDALAQIHRQAKAGTLPPPDELNQNLAKFVMGQMNMVSELNESGPQVFAQARPKAESLGPLSDIIKFHDKPRDIVQYLDKSIIGQSAAKQTLARAVFYHYNAIRQAIKGTPIKGYQKNNVVLIGHPGSGKTSLVRSIAELLDVPFVRFDATQFSPTGIVGKDASAIVREMVQTAKQNKQLAEYGIVFVDEFDKLVKGYGLQGSSDSFGKDIQATFLRILEDQEVDLLPEHHPLNMLGMGKSGEKIKTDYMLFIVSGAFDGLADIVAKRLGSYDIGFGSDYPSGEAYRKQALLEHVTHADLVSYGFISQLAGRLPIIAALHELSEDHLYQILSHAEGNILDQYKEQIKTATGTAVHFDDDALHAMARKAYTLGTGARGLATVCEGTLKHLMFDLPQLTGIPNLYITPDALEHPRQMIFTDFITGFKKRTGITITFCDEAVDQLLNGKFGDPLVYLDRSIEALPAALRLIEAKSFVVTPEYLRSPTDFLKSYIERIETKRWR